MSRNFVGGLNAGGNPAVSIANLDNQGFAEIIIGNDVLTLAKDAMDRVADAICEEVLRRLCDG